LPLRARGYGVVPHSAPPAGRWRDAQHWQRRVWGVAPADKKVGTRRCGDVTTAHGRGRTWPAASPTSRCGRRSGERDVGGRRPGRHPPPRIYSAVVVTAAMPVLAYPTWGKLIGAPGLPPFGCLRVKPWQRRVGGVAPVDDKVGKIRVGDAATVHRPCELRRSGAGAPSCGLESRGVHRRTAGTPEPIFNVDESPAGRPFNADAVPASWKACRPWGSGSYRHGCCRLR